MHSFVGIGSVEVADKQQGIAFPMFVLYPTDTPSRATPVGRHVLDVATGAPVAPGRFPLALISHGSGGSNLAYHTLATHLARNGFVVCLPEHPFNNRTDNRLEGTPESFTNRLRHIGLALDQMFSAGPSKQFLRPGTAAVIGHSIGANAALVLAGGRPIPQAEYQAKFGPFPMSRESRDIPLTQDRRIRAAVLLAPAPGWFTGAESLTEVHADVLMLYAEKDEYCPRAHAEAFRNGLGKNSRIHCRMVPNAGHFSFLSPFPAAIKARVGAAATDPEGFDREQFHRELNAEVLDFLTESLR